MVLSSSTKISEARGTEESQSMIQWIKEYADYAGPKTVEPSIEQVKAACENNFPSLSSSDSDLDHLLEELGIHVIADYGTYRIAWLGTTDATTADTLLEKYQQPIYSQVRKNLGIDYLWILKINEERCHMANDIFEADVEFMEMDVKPECVIVNL